jgi:hypothetical protein
MRPSRTFGKDNPRRGRCVWIALVLLCAIGAAAATRRIVALGTAPAAGSSDFGALDVHFAGKAGMTLVHIVPSLLFVLLVPMQFVSPLRRCHPRLHRWTGRGIVVLGLVFALGKAWWHIRNGRVGLHREWATRMVAVALGVATTRPIMAVFFATSGLTGLTPQQFFGPAMWLGFISTFLAGETWINYARLRTAQNGSDAISFVLEK